MVKPCQVSGVEQHFPTLLPLGPSSSMRASLCDSDESLPRMTLSKITGTTTVPVHKLPRCLLPEPVDSPSLGLSPPSHLSTITLEDLELLLTEGPASLEPLSVEASERYECNSLVSSSLVPEHDTPKRWKQLEQW